MLLVGGRCPRPQWPEVEGLALSGWNDGGEGIAISWFIPSTGPLANLLLLLKTLVTQHKFVLWALVCWGYEHSLNKAHRHSRLWSSMCPSRKPGPGSPMQVRYFVKLTRKRSETQQQRERTKLKRSNHGAEPQYRL